MRSVLDLTYDEFESWADHALLKLSTLHGEARTAFANEVFEFLKPLCDRKPELWEELVRLMITSRKCSDLEAALTSQMETLTPEQRTQVEQFGKLLAEPPTTKKQ